MLMALQEVSQLFLSWTTDIECIESIIFVYPLAFVYGKISSVYRVHVV